MTTPTGRRPTTAAPRATATPPTGHDRSIGCRPPGWRAPRTTPSPASGCRARSRASASSGRRRSRSGWTAWTSTPEAVIATWKEHFPEFWPKGQRFYAPLSGIAPGEVALLEIQPVPGAPVKLSTGVLVLYADDESFTFMTPEGHTLSAWITFSARRDGDVTSPRPRRSSDRPTRSTISPTRSAATARTTSSGRRRCATSRSWSACPSRSSRSRSASASTATGSGATGATSATARRSAPRAER